MPINDIMINKDIIEFIVPNKYCINKKKKKDNIKDNKTRNIIDKKNKLYIKTNNGIVSIDELTNENSIKKRQIEKVFKINYTGEMICFQKNSIAKNIPYKKTLLRPDKIIYYNKKYSEAKEFINNNTITEEYINNIPVYELLFSSLKRGIYSCNNIKIISFDPQSNLSRKYYYKKKKKEKKRQLKLKKREKKPKKKSVMDKIVKLITTLMEYFYKTYLLE